MTTWSLVSIMWLTILGYNLGIKIKSLVIAGFWKKGWKILVQELFVELIIWRLFMTENMT